VSTLTRTEFAATATEVANELKGLGINLDVTVQDMMTFFSTYYDPKLKTGLSIGMGCRSSYVAATQCMTWFDGHLMTDASTGNGTLIGTTPEQLASWGYGNVTVPNEDARIEACLPLLGAAQFQCWATVDQYLMQEIVPWVPYSQWRSDAITSPRVVTYGFDELATTTALDQLALKQ
jgi:hypothetical protein